jgi:hypothetical protein
VAWEPARAVTSSPGADDVEPHPLPGSSADTVELYWGEGVPPGGSAYSIVRDAAVSVRERLFADGFGG